MKKKEEEEKERSEFQQWKECPQQTAVNFTFSEYVAGN